MGHRARTIPAPFPIRADELFFADAVALWKLTRDPGLKIGHYNLVRALRFI